MRILVVDDSVILVTLIVMILETLEINTHITKCTDKDMALDEIRDASNDYDLIVTDLQMPEADDGLMVAIAAKIKSSQTKVIMILGKFSGQPAGDDGLAVPLFRRERLARVGVFA